MTNQHPITPPLELVDSIWNQFKTGPTRNLLTSEAFREAITKASQWGADQELEACCEWLTCGGLLPRLPALTESLLAARRPKTPSLKEQALAALGEMSIEPCLINGVDANAAVRAKYNTIRRALEALND